jgi:multidrug efflux system membrane fusion protein
MRFLLKLLLFPFRLAGRAVHRCFLVLGGLLHSFRFWVWSAIAVILLIVAYYVVADRATPLTTEAYVQAYVVQVAPQVEGQVVRVYVREGERVQKGTLLFELDPRPFEHKVALLRAKLVEVEQQVKQLDTQKAAAQAEHRRLTAEANYAQAVYEQEKQIYRKESTTERKYLDALQKQRASAAALERSAHQVRHVEESLEARIGGEHALIAQVKAQLAEARLNLEYTKIFAPCDGIVTDLQLRAGAYAHVGQSMLTCIDTDQWVIVANFREDSLERMRTEQPALVAFRGLPGRLLPAHVQWIGWGVGQGQGTPSGQLPDVKNQSNWIPAAQRFQVRLVLDDPEAMPLRVGMTCSVSVYTNPEERLNPVTRGIHRLLAWFYYL